MKNVAIVLAAGSGSRFGSSVPKQFVPLKGREVIEHSLDLFDSHTAVDEVAVVLNPQWRDHFEALAARRRWTKLTAILDGGAERWQSTLAAVRHYATHPDCNLLLHDAARPWLSASILQRVTDALLQHQAVAVAIPATDTLFRVAHGCIADVPPRAEFFCAQTPQAFRLDLIADAYRLALQDPSFVATDDCGVLHRYRPDVHIHIVHGSPDNIKITHPLDLTQE